MTVDEPLMEAWEPRNGRGRVSDAVMDRAEELLPPLLEAGFVSTDEEGWKWWFTEAGVARAEELERLR